MKRVTIIGLGTGAGSVTADARAAISAAEVIIGSERLLGECSGFEGRAYGCALPRDMAEVIRGEIAEELAVLVSGDVGFFSAAAGLRELLPDCELRLVPGISSAGAFFARLGLSWQDCVFLSAHGRETGLVDAVRRNRLVFCLTGGNVGELGRALLEAGFGELPVHVGENLGLEGERVYETTAQALIEGSFPSLTVLLFENTGFDSRCPAGLPDESFCREPGIPMTKSEIRAIVMSKLRLCPEDICWDVGAGSGSVTAEMALSAYRGRVYAVERRESAIALILRNCAAMHIGNVTVSCGVAPAALVSLPAPDAVFIGGSGGELGEIVSAALRANPAARLVITAVTPETVMGAISALTAAGLEPELVQINAARGRAVGGLHLMEAQNPVTIIAGGGRK